MHNTFKVQVVRRGIITLPKEWEHNRIEAGDMLTLSIWGMAWSS